MKALVFRGTNQIAIEEAAEPSLLSDEVRIEVAYCGICGSDLHGFLGHSARRSRNVPLVMGHEFSGRITEIGPAARSDLALGQRVTVQPLISCGSCPACRSGRANICPSMAILGIERAGAFAPSVTVPAHRVFPLPDTLSDQGAALVETLAIEVHLFREMAPSLLRSVLVLGAGAQGLLAIQLARLLNVPQIIASDVVPSRLELAARCGATRTVQAKEADVVQIVKEVTEGWGVELAVETTGAPPARLQGLAALAPGGLLGLVGLGEGQTTVDFLPIVARELTLRGSYCYTDDDFVRSIELLSSRQIRADGLISVQPLSAGPAVFKTLIESPASGVKVLLQPD